MSVLIALLYLYGSSWVAHNQTWYLVKVAKHRFLLGYRNFFLAQWMRWIGSRTNRTQQACTARWERSRALYNKEVPYQRTTYSSARRIGNLNTTVLPVALRFCFWLTLLRLKKTLLGDFTWKIILTWK